MDISGRTPPRRIPQHLCWGGVHLPKNQKPNHPKRGGIILHWVFGHKNIPGI